MSAMDRADLLAPMAPEFRLLCLAARGAGPEETAATCAKVGDWDAVWSGALFHRLVTPLEAAIGRTAPGVVPKELVRNLQRQVIVESLQCRGLAAELTMLVRLFKAAAIPVLVLKGIALSIHLYGAPASRGLGDIDLLVAPAELKRADRVLRQAGYRRKGAAFIECPAGPRHARIKDICYVHGDTKVVVELHQRLTENPHLLPWAHEDLWRQREFVEVEGTAVPVMPAHLLPVYLAVHGAGHCWERLRWLADLADLLRPGRQAEQALATAREMGLERPFGDALALCHHWLGLPVDASLVPSPGTLSPFIRRFFAGNRWNHSPRPGDLEWLRRQSLWGRLHRLSLRAEWRYRAWELIATLVWPPDWEVIRLPDSLFWLYPALRPLGWVLRRRHRP